MTEHSTFLRKAEVHKRTGLSDTTIWRLENRSEFPKRIQITEKIVGWAESEIEAWQQARLDDRNQPHPASVQ